MNGSSRIGRANITDGGRPTLIGPPWRIVGTGDFNLTGATDLIWHNALTGESKIWFMRGHQVMGSATVLGEDGNHALANTPWSIVGINDMSGDKKADVIWHNGASNHTQIWLMDGHRVTGRVTVLAENGSQALVGLPWRIVGSNDFNGDGKTDLLWHNSATGESQIWNMNGHSISGREVVVDESGKVINVGLPWRVGTTDDFNQDGAADILWHNGSSGHTQIWLMNGRRIVRRVTVDADRDGGEVLVGLPWSVMGAPLLASAGSSSPVPKSEASAPNLNRLAARGRVVTDMDPLAVELRDQQPDESARLGFDIGMGAAEGQTAPGPGKDKIRDSLPDAERRGFITAVAFSLERNRYADRAAKGAAIARADATVRAARDAEEDVFYRLGFDIGTAIFGDPARGAQGATSTGPGSLGIRDSLSAAGQRGFNDAVKFHLGRQH